MIVRETKLQGVVVVEPEVRGDDRGFFLESYHEKKYQDAGIDAVFVQDNHSRSTRGVLRGLHMQLIRPQAKLVRVLDGLIYDVAVDARVGSPTFGEYFGTELSSDKHHQLFVPVGFVHGFAVVSEVAEVEYKCTDFYEPSGELSIAWNDPKIGIPWPIENPILSPKDANAPTLSEAMERLPRYEG